MHQVHIIHDEDGRILAVADAAVTSGPGGIQLHHQPRPRPGQHAILVTLADEHRDHTALALIREFEVDRDAPEPALRRRSP
jgi:hypothetical protein